ncbi:MAG TPA: type II toxin-antitoxin system RelE/ParE family toxin [Pirellulaceae bacterium]
MSYRIIIRAVADDDIAQAAKWYERKAGLGHDFVASVRASLNKLQTHPDFGIVVFKHLRRLRMRRFPYGIFYVIETTASKYWASFMHAVRRDYGKSGSATTNSHTCFPLLTALA